MMNRRSRKEKLIMPLDMEGTTTFPGSIVTDPFGSYTGLVADPEDKPVQDADDL